MTQTDFDPNLDLEGNLRKVSESYAAERQKTAGELAHLNAMISRLEGEKEKVQAEAQKISDNLYTRRAETVLEYFGATAAKLKQKEDDMKVVAYLDSDNFRGDLEKLGGIGRDQFRDAMEERRIQAQARLKNKLAIEVYLTREVDGEKNIKVSVLYAPILWDKAEKSDTIEEALHISLLKVAEDFNGIEGDAPKQGGNFTVCKFPPKRKGIEENERDLIERLQKGDPDLAVYNLEYKVCIDRESIPKIEAIPAEIETIPKPEIEAIPEPKITGIELNIKEAAKFVEQVAREQGNLSLTLGGYGVRVKRAIYRGDLPAEKVCYTQSDKFYYKIKEKDLLKNLESLASPVQRARNFTVKEAAKMLVDKGKSINMAAAEQMIYYNIWKGKITGVKKKRIGGSKFQHILNRKHVRELLDS